MTQILQDESEISALVDLFVKEGVRSYLEIGAKFGGSLNRIARALPKGSRIVAVDMPKGTKAWPESNIALSDTVARLKRDGYDSRIIWGDSQFGAVVNNVLALGPFDAIFLDADHRLAGVRNDWHNYGPMGRLIAFHDIAWRRAPEWVGVRIDVPQFWDGIKGSYRNIEFKYCPTGKNNGIGVLWRA
jgi:predicted O-methyltransferase YrrM